MENNVGNNFNVAAVIVTFNRLYKLKKTIEAYENLSYKPKYIIVVNNASNDGTLEFLDDWSKIESDINKIVINMLENTGGSGGFFVGQKKAMELDDVDWVMVADDDAYPDQNYLFRIKEYLEENSNANNISVICGRVNEGGSFVSTHRTIMANFFSFHIYKPITEDIYLYNKEIYLDFASYVGIVISKRSLYEVGLVNPDFFIYQDDTEHTNRLKKCGSLICLPEISMFHDCGVDKQKGCTWKAYYDYRNRLFLCKDIDFLKFLYLIMIHLVKALLCPLKGRKLGDVWLRLNAILDAIRGKLGKHKVYIPGWKP